MASFNLKVILKCHVQHTIWTNIISTFFASHKYVDTEKYTVKLSEHKMLKYREWDSVIARDK